MSMMFQQHSSASVVPIQIPVPNLYNYLCKYQIINNTNFKIVRNDQHREIAPFALYTYLYVSLFFENAFLVWKKKNCQSPPSAATTKKARQKNSFNLNDTNRFTTIIVVSREHIQQKCYVKQQYVIFTSSSIPL